MTICEPMILVRPDQPTVPMSMQLDAKSVGYVLLESGVQIVPAGSTVEIDDDQVRCSLDDGDVWVRPAIELVGFGIDRDDLIESGRRLYQARHVH